MTVSASVCITLLSLFIQLQFVYSADKWHEPTVPHNHANPIGFTWFYDLKLSEHRTDGLRVYPNNSSAPSYTIYANPFRDTEFVILDSMNRTVLEAKEDDEAKCHQKYTYQAFPDANYTIDPRHIETNHWNMTILDKHGNPVDLTYYRPPITDMGDVFFNCNGSVAAKIRHGYWELITPDNPYHSSQSTPHKFVHLEMEPSVAIDPKNFIGLWALVKLRIDRCQIN